MHCSYMSSMSDKGASAFHVKQRQQVINLADKILEFGEDSTVCAHSGYELARMFYSRCLFIIIHICYLYDRSANNFTLIYMSHFN